MIGISAFQIIVAVMPGEPIEIASGYAFGWLLGAILCLLGSILGQTIVFLVTKKYGLDFVEIFISEEKLKKIKFLEDKYKIYLSIFFIFLMYIPVSYLSLLLMTFSPNKYFSSISLSFLLSCSSFIPK